MRKKYQMADIGRILQKKKKKNSIPQVDNPDRIYKRKKISRKSHTWAPLIVAVKFPSLQRILYSIAC